MDLEFNKIAAAILTAGIIAMVSGIIAGALVHPKLLEKPV
jgi:cytochrome c